MSGRLRACARSIYQALFPPPPKSLGTRLAISGAAFTLHLARTTSRNHAYCIFLLEDGWEVKVRVLVG